MEVLRNTGRAKSTWSVRWTGKKNGKTNHCAAVGPSEMRVCAKSCTAAVKYDACEEIWEPTTTWTQCDPIIYFILRIRQSSSEFGQLDGPERKMAKQITVQQSGLRK